MTKRGLTFAVIAAACVLGGIALVVVGAFGPSTQKTTAKVGLGSVPIGRLVSLRTIVGAPSDVLRVAVAGVVR